MKEVGIFKYLRVSKSERAQTLETREKNKKEYIRRLRMLMKSELNDWNLVKGNIVTYIFISVWKLDEIWINKSILKKEGIQYEWKSLSSSRNDKPVFSRLLIPVENYMKLDINSYAVNRKKMPLKSDSWTVEDKETKQRNVVKNQKKEASLSDREEKDLHNRFPTIVAKKY